MGGNAIKCAERVSKEYFIEVAADILPKIRRYYPRAEIVIAYASKDTFGDMDIVIGPRLHKPFFPVWPEDIPTKEKVFNNDNLSFEYRGMQIDLIAVPEKFIGTALFYYSYNDLNNLVGRIAHKFGVKFGWDGLTYQIRTEFGHKAQKVQLSTDPRTMYTFLGYDYDRYLQGFDSLQDIFNFVVDNPFFNVATYQEDQQNHQNRTRNRKRKTMQAFMSWLNSQEWPEGYAFHRDKSVYLIRTHNFFPEARLLNNLLEYAEDKKAHDFFTSRFNGDLVMAWTGLAGKELGQFMGAFEKSVSTTRAEFKAWASSKEVNEIEEWVKGFFSACEYPNAT